MTGVEYQDLWSLCEARAREHPDRVVLDFDGKLWTWAELIAAAEGLAGGLVAAGVGAGEVVGHMSPNHPEAVVTMLALLRLGAVECPVNAGLRGQQLAHVLDHSGARVLIVDGSLVDRVSEQLPSAPGVRGDRGARRVVRPLSWRGDLRLRRTPAYRADRPPPFSALRRRATR